MYAHRSAAPRPELDVDDRDCCGHQPTVASVTHGTPLPQPVDDASETRPGSATVTP